MGHLSPPANRAVGRLASIATVFCLAVATLPLGSLSASAASPSTRSLSTASQKRVNTALAAIAQSTTWTPQSSGTAADLFSISCPSISVCFAVGSSNDIRGIILATTDGGVTWTAQSPFSAAANTPGISCPSINVCFVAGWYSIGNILATTDGGATWSSQSSSIFTNLYGISCPSTSVCFAVGQNSGTIQATTDGGATWTAQSSSIFTNLYGISCPSTSVCFAVGGPGNILATTSGGATWTAQSSGTTNSLYGISCPSTSVCFAVGDYGDILATTNGGATWTAQSSGTNLHAISCPSTSVCFAVGQGGTILATTNGGATWTAQPSSTTANLYGIGCPSTSVCFAVGQGGTILAYGASVGGSLHPTATTVTCSPSRIVSNDTTSCTATVTDTASTGATAPTGTVTFSTNGSGAFVSLIGGPILNSCELSGIGTSAQCQVFYTAGISPGVDTITANYLGDSAHSASNGATTVTILPPPLLTLGGPVMTTQTVHLIFWFPPYLQDGSSAAVPNQGQYVNTLEQYFKDIGGSGLYMNNTQYYQVVGGQRQYIQNQVIYGGAILDRRAYLPGCPIFSPPNCMSDTFVRAEIQHAIKQRLGWTSGLNQEYFVFTAPGEVICGEWGCAGSGGNCGYHDHFGPFNGQDVIYAVIPYPGSNAGCQSSVAATGGPHGAIVDTAVSNASHEQMESATDPLGSDSKLTSPGSEEKPPQGGAAWGDAKGSEIGDKCVGKWGPVRFPDGGNVILNGHSYLVQEEWDNQGPLQPDGTQCVISWLPYPLQNVNAVVGSAPGQVTVNFTTYMPADDVGLPITLFKVSAIRGNRYVTSQIVDGSARVAYFTGLPKGRYTFQVAALNSNGQGPTTSSSPVLVH